MIKKSLPHKILQASLITAYIIISKYSSIHVSHGCVSKILYVKNQSNLGNPSHNCDSTKKHKHLDKCMLQAFNSLD